MNIMPKNNIIKKLGMQKEFQNWVKQKQKLPKTFEDIIKNPAAIMKTFKDFSVAIEATGKFIGEEDYEGIQLAEKVGKAFPVSSTMINTYKAGKKVY